MRKNVKQGILLTKNTFFLHFYIWIRIRIRILNADPDPDPATQINADPDPDPQPCLLSSDFNGQIYGRKFWKAHWNLSPVYCNIRSSVLLLASVLPSSCPLVTSFLASLL